MATGMCRDSGGAAGVARPERGRSSGVAPATARAVPLAAVFGAALAYMSDDMLNVALPSVARDLGATVTDAQWILTAHEVALAAGAIGDVVGHRRVFAGGILTFSSSGARRTRCCRRASYGAAASWAAISSGCWAA